MKINLDLKPGKCGDWEVKQFHVSEEDARWSQVRNAVNGHGERAVSAGDYWMLTERGEIYMSNTPAEVMDHWPFIRVAKGSVLIAGLGLGMVIKALLDKESVTRIVVVEKSEEVINLVGWAYEKDPRVEIVKSDIFDYKPKEHFDYAWFDIWPYITGDNYPEMKRLHRKFARHATVKDSWCRAMCQRRWKYEQ